VGVFLWERLQPRCVESLTACRESRLKPLPQTGTATLRRLVNGLKLRQAAGVLMPADIDAVNALLVP